MIRTLFAAVCLLVVVPAAAADELAVLGEKIGQTTPKEMMHSHLMRLAHAALDRRDAEYEKIKTPEQIAAYQERMRQFYVDALGGFPERTPLKAQVTGKLDRDGYRIEKIIYQSQPEHYVTALLYLPKTDPPYPGVLLPCGHSGNGKAAEAYQRASVLLAKNGLAEQGFLLTEKEVRRLRPDKIHWSPNEESILPHQGKVGEVKALLSSLETRDPALHKQLVESVKKGLQAMVEQQDFDFDDD